MTVGSLCWEFNDPGSLSGLRWGRYVNTCNREMFCNLIAIELKLFRQFHAVEGHILTKIDYCLIIVSRVIELSRGASRAFVGGRELNTCNMKIFCNLIAIELKLYRQCRAGEANILTKFDYCRIIMSGVIELSRGASRAFGLVDT